MKRWERARRAAKSNSDQIMKSGREIGGGEGSTGHREGLE